MRRYEELGLSLDQVKRGLALLQSPRTRKGKRLDPIVAEQDGRYSFTRLLGAEQRIAAALRRLQDANLPGLDIPGNVFGTLQPDDSQIAAVELAADNGVVVMTGGPGRGKTTVAKAMLRLYESLRGPVLCCAPSGKAAVRMAEQTGRNASTIHSLLGMVPGKPPRFDAKNRLEASAVVVDEASMIDAELMAHLLDAVPTGTRLLIIGDVDQLPSIGAGRVLYDLIESDVVPVVRLTKIHRQASESRIPYVAADINEGRMPDLSAKNTDVTHWEQADAATAASWIVRAMAEEIPNGKGFTIDKIQVLAAQYGDKGEEKNPVGVAALNLALQDRLNPLVDKKAQVFIGRSYGARLRDRVIQTRNNYDLDVRNGEIGYVVELDVQGIKFDTERHADVLWTGKLADEAAQACWPKAPVLIVNFDGHHVAYTKDEARELQLAYVITIHKSQGSQFDAVILVAHSAHSFMLTRALLYTGLTRAARYCLFVGQASQIAQSARNTRGTHRRTWLPQLLRA